LWGPKGEKKGKKKKKKNVPFSARLKRGSLNLKLNRARGGFPRERKRVFEKKKTLLSREVKWEGTGRGERVVKRVAWTSQKKKKRVGEEKNRGGKTLFASPGKETKEGKKKDYGFFGGAQEG